MSKKLTLEFIHKMFSECKTVYFLSSGANIVSRIYEPEKVEINEYAYWFQIRFPGYQALLSINKDVVDFTDASLLHPDDTKHGIVSDTTLGCIFMENGDEILFDSEYQ